MRSTIHPAFSATDRGGRCCIEIPAASTRNSMAGKGLWPRGIRGASTAAGMQSMSRWSLARPETTARWSNEL